MDGNSQKPTGAVTILGSGTCVPSLERSSCSVLVQVEETTLLLDTGRGTIQRLLETGKSIFDIDVIAYSHFHPDHTGELVSLLFSTKYPDAHRRQKPLTVVGGPGLTAFFEGLRRVFGRWIELPPDRFALIELADPDARRLSFDALDLLSASVTHNPESVAYRIELVSGASMVYSGDTDYSKNLITLAQAADLLICEASHPDELKTAGHLTPSLAGKIATRADVGCLVLTHFYPDCDQTDISAECRKAYGGPLILAEDLLKIPL